MDASDALGLFLREWRETWLGWSRERLARAISRRVGRPLRKNLVRAWEDGQPPTDTAELLALEALLRESGLTEHEIGDFRTTVLGALAVRRYPGLEPIVDVLHSPDAEAVTEREASSWDGSFVRAVALHRALTEAVLGDAGPECPRQRRVQEAALAQVRIGLTCRHEWAGRFDRMAVLAARSGEYIRTFFGDGGLGDSRSVLSREATELWARRLAGASPEHSRRLAAISAEALRRGLPITATAAYFWAVDASVALPEPEAAELLRHADRMHDLCHEVRPNGIEPHFHLMGQARMRGDWDEVERQLVRMESERDFGALPLVLRLLAWAELRLARAQTADAERLYADALEAAVAGGYAKQEREAREGLRKCSRE